MAGRGKGFTPARARRLLTAGAGTPGSSNEAVRERYAEAAPAVQEQLLGLLMEGLIPDRERIRLGLGLLAHQAKVEDDARKMLDTGASLFDPADGVGDGVPESPEDIAKMEAELERMRGSREVNYQERAKKAKVERAHLRLVASRPKEEEAA